MEMPVVNFFSLGLPPQKRNISYNTPGRKAEDGSTVNSEKAPVKAGKE
jgi:hypothetical protein